MNALRLSFLPLALALLTATQPARAETLLFRAAVVHTIAKGDIVNGEVLVKDGKIALIGRGLPTEGANVIELKGQHLYPGLISPNTSLGLVEIGAVRASVDTTEVGSFTPDVQAWIAINPDSELIPVARANGITHALVVPSGGIISGQSGLIALAGWGVEGMTVKRPVAMHLDWPEMALDTTPKEQLRDSSKWKSPEDQAKDRRKKVKEIEDFFDEAKAYAKARTAAAKDFRPHPAWESMLPVVRGELPVFVHADELRQIKSALHWATNRNQRIVIVGGRDAALAADALAKAKTPVIFEHVFTLPPRDSDAHDVHFRAAGQLHKAGVTVAFGLSLGAWGASGLRNLPYSAAQAAAHGLPETEALKSITLYPAQILGVSDRLGSIEPGKEASLIATDGNLLDIRSNVKRMWIAGKETSLESRHTRLYEKYRNRPKAK
ncbi:MAG: amidohydrolase [Pedosphaera sp.]|nr:amidohydrolase [Pedosphaera sp.]MSS99939.1 amidohydrolase [Pedosphaera sp.]